jgi:hypothetical protein
MECKENYRRVMAACGRKVYDNYKYIIKADLIIIISLKINMGILVK